MTTDHHDIDAKDVALEEFVSARVAGLQARYRRDDPPAVAALARLRRGVATPAGSRPDLWVYTLDKLPPLLTDSAADRNGTPTAWEQAAHDAITLHAWHQQSRSDGMHRPGTSLGTAARILGWRSNSEQAVRRRFHALGATSQHNVRLGHLRGLVSQFRTESISLDYGRLARDLRQLGDPATAAAVLLEWGRDYHREYPVKSSGTEQASDPVKGESA
ncbi:type I-E CRISPR-associated protein Cse2/CasB [Nocardia wallacei]|uniref:type I-E CRISPR-associated protein Cse2/CasB n=1 Tax=Nocardia wallacei TaxID=480035 RepID=UPI0024564C4D|nr:type I-E CRISPR-associated protein Cse2/CasB [Nocardia wallacei]